MFTEHPVRVPPLPLSQDVQYKALANPPIQESPSPEGTVHLSIVAPIYRPEQHETWAKMVAQQQALLTQGGVCEAYLEGRTKMAYPTNRIPTLAECSAALFKHSGWRVIRVGGFVPEDKFFLLLAQKVFPCTDFIRHPSELPYTPAPDMFHDLMGHLPLINIEEFAVFFHNYGLAGQNAKNPQDIVELGRIYWHTVEFGLINPSAFKGPHRDPSCTQVYGAGIASSVGEIPHALSPQVPKYPFDIEKVAQTAYDIHEMQAHYFEIESFSQLQKDFYTWASQKGLL